MEQPEVELNEDTYEDVFWLQVLGDHMRIFVGTLEAKEKTYLATAETLKKELDALLEDARIQSLDVDAIDVIIDRVRDFKLQMISLRMNNEIGLNLPPFFPSHMLNELEEYINIFRGEGESLILQQHKLWLNDAAGHAGSLIADLDITEKSRKQDLKKIMKRFECLHSAVLETIGYNRADDVPNGWIDELSEKARQQITAFFHQLNEMEELQADNALMSRIPKLVFDHMKREEAYYIAKILDSLNQPKAALPWKEVAIRRRIE